MMGSTAAPQTKKLQNKKLQNKTLALIEFAREVLLASAIAMTVRQCFYQLVVRHYIENRFSEYRRLERALVDGRKLGLIPWESIEDRLRKPRMVPMWVSVKDFSDAVVPQYRRNAWDMQPQYVHVWLEKDALSGIFEDALEPYGVTLNVGRGYDSWSSLYEAANRFRRIEKPMKILYFGDFDPSGEHMLASLEERFDFFGVYPDIKRVAILQQDIERYSLPPDFTKATDPRRDNFVARYGDEAVELDALPPDVLLARLLENVESNLDLEQLSRTRELEERERQRIAAALGRIRIGRNGRKS